MPKKYIYLVRPTLEYAQDLRDINGWNIRFVDYQLFSKNRFILGHFKRKNQEITPDITRIFAEQSSELLQEYLFALKNEQLEIISVKDKSEFTPLFSQFRRCYRDIKGILFDLDW